MKSASLRCPAKVNLYLAVTGRRGDGFHNLVSLVAQTASGDHLSAQWFPAAGSDRLHCSDPALPTDSGNLVLRATAAAREIADIPGHFVFSLDKGLPFGAGLGGGSSDGVGALRLVQRLTGALAEAQVARVARELGSDCALFLDATPKVIRGRGELITSLPLRMARALAGRQLLLAQPSVTVSTPWAYGQLAECGVYTPEGQAEVEVMQLLRRLPTLPSIALRNDFLAVVGGKFLTIPVVLEALNQLPGVMAGMSGSGSAIFALVDHHVAASHATRVIREAWGEGAWLEATELLG